MTSINIRKMKKSDGDFVLEIRNDDSTRYRLHNSDKFSIDQFNSFYDDKKPWWFITSLNGEDFGYFRTDYVDVEKKSIQVGMDIHPEFRGKGLAKLSYKELFSCLKDKGFQKVWLAVLKSNTLAHSIYEKMGFVEVGKKEYGDDESIQMEKFI